MKKFFAMLMMATLVFSVDAVAQKYDLTNTAEGDSRAFPILEASSQYKDGYRIYKKSNTLTMNYQVSGSINRIYQYPNGNYYTNIDQNGTTPWDLGHVIFTTNQDVTLGLWYDIDPNATPNELRVDLSLKVNDYGIYFLDEDDAITGEHTFYSMKDAGVQVTAGREFGVYFEADVDYLNEKVYSGKYNINMGYDKTDELKKVITTTENWLASYDKSKEAEPHLIDGNTWYSNEPIRTTSEFMCLFQGDNYVSGQPVYLEWDHIEFGFVTGEPVGQPLPGTIATILISGLCAAGLRKRNKK